MGEQRRKPRDSHTQSSSHITLCSHLTLAPPDFLHHIFNCFEYRVSVNLVTAVLDDNLSSPGRKVRELDLQLMDPNLMKIR